MQLKEQDKGIKDPLVPYFHEIFPYFLLDRATAKRRPVGIGLISRNTISGQNGEELNERRKKAAYATSAFAVLAW